MGVRTYVSLGGVLKEWVEAPSLEPYRKVDGHQIVTAIASLRRRLGQIGATGKWSAPVVPLLIRESLRRTRHACQTVSDAIGGLADVTKHV